MSLSEQEQRSSMGGRAVAVSQRLISLWKREQIPEAPPINPRFEMEDGILEVIFQEPEAQEYMIIAKLWHEGEIEMEFGIKRNVEGTRFLLGGEVERMVVSLEEALPQIEEGLQ